jgi:hypothetical protein
LEVKGVAAKAYFLITAQLGAESGLTNHDESGEVSLSPETVLSQALYRLKRVSVQLMGFIHHNYHIYAAFTGTAKYIKALHGTRFHITPGTGAGNEFLPQLVDYAVHDMGYFDACTIRTEYINHTRITPVSPRVEHIIGGFRFA